MSNSPSPSIERAALIPWMCVAAGALSLVYWLASYWSNQPESADRLLILVAAGWLLVRCKDELTLQPRRPTVLGLILIAPAAVLIPAVWYLFAIVGPMPLLLWWLAIALLAAVAGLILVQFGASHMCIVAFPLLFVLFALPFPVGLHGFLQSHLQQVTITAAERILSFVGVEVQRKGFVLSLPSGDLGVVEACSGVRGVTAIIAVAALIAYVRGLGIWRGTLLTLLALPVIACSNILRVVLSGVLQERIGPAVNQGTPHTMFGVLTLLLGLGAVLGLSQLMRPRTQKGLEHDHTSELAESMYRQGQSSGIAQGAATTLLGLALAGSIAAVWWADPWSRGEEPSAPIESIALQIGQWIGRDEPIDSGIREVLAYDAAVHRAYVNGSGQRVECWVMYWKSQSAVKNYAHHPDICWPNQGWKRIEQGRRPVALPPPAELSMTVRRYELEGRRQFLGYWAQDGARVWTDEDERRGRGEGPFGARTLERFFSRSPGARTPRLVVIVGANLWDTGGYAEGKVEEFAAELAMELYRVCPWALPAVGR